MGWLNVAELARVWTYLEEVQILANSATKSPSRRRPSGLNADSNCLQRSVVMSTALAPTIEEIRQAARRLRDVSVRTPLVPLHSFSDRSTILLKPEIHQPVTSFKIRGVYNAVASLTDEDRSRGLSTVSAGNTAQALAWAGRHFALPKGG